MSAPFGHPDWLAAEPTDTTSLVVDQLVARTGPTTIGRFNVAGYGYLRGLLQSDFQTTVVTVDWYPAPAGGQSIGKRVFVIDSRMGAAPSISLPNLGPFVQISFAGMNGGTNWHETAILWATNRPAPLVFEPARPLLVNAQDASVLAGTTVDFWGLAYFAGRVQVYMLALNVNLTVQLHCYDNTTADVLAGQWVATNGVDRREEIVLPLGAWRLSVNNGTATNAGVYLVVIPDYSPAA